jgi:HK97 family phage major capsid protein
MRRLAVAGGGNTIPILIGQRWTQTFFGDPVNFATPMPSATATTGICLYYGDLAAASKFGDRRQVEISMSQEASVGGQSLWERDEIGVKGTERVDIVVHERGTASKGGAINALITG